MNHRQMEFGEGDVISTYGDGEIIVKRQHMFERILVETPTHQFPVKGDSQEKRGMILASILARMKDSDWNPGSGLASGPETIPRDIAIAGKPWIASYLYLKELEIKEISSLFDVEKRTVEQYIRDVIAGRRW